MAGMMSCKRAALLTPRRAEALAAFLCALAAFVPAPCAAKPTPGTAQQPGARAAARQEQCALCDSGDEGARHRPPPDADTLQHVARGGDDDPGRGPPPLPVPLSATVPLRGVSVVDPLIAGTMEANIDYLLRSFTVDHILYPFRIRSGQQSPPTGPRPQVGFWDSDLKGANAGRFLMGAGNTLRWLEHPALRQMLNDVVDGVAECANGTYILAYHPDGFTHSEQGDYGRSWFTQGLIEAGKSGHPRAFPMLRGLYDWFNDADKNPYLPYLYDGISNGEQGQIASTRVYLETPVGVYADSQVAQDTWRDDVWMRQLIARDPAGISAYHMPRPNHPHCYEITSFLSMFDNYRATHNATWLAAAAGAWSVVMDNFVHADGSSSLTEGAPDDGTDWKAKTYRIAPGTGTGETCCTSFWIKFTQRFQLLDPANETYAAVIENAVYNALLRQIIRPTAAGAASSGGGGGTSSSGTSASTSTMAGRDGGPSHSQPPPDDAGLSFASRRFRAAVAAWDSDDGAAGGEAQGKAAPPTPPLPPGIRYHAAMEGVQERGNVANTCCEGQGTRVFGSLPEYVWSVSANPRTSSPSSARDGVYVNMFVASTLEFNASVAEGKGFVPPVPPSPAPPVPLPPPPPPPEMTFRLLVDNGWVGGGTDGLVYKVPSVHTLADCQAVCLASQHPAMCYGLTWVAKTPDGPPLCMSDCEMVGLPADPTSGTGPVFTGTYNLSLASNVTTVGDCNAACLRDPTCVQTTWSRRPANPCVLYQSIDNKTVTYPNSKGFVKCASGSKTGPACAFFGSPDRCSLYTSIDESCLDPPPGQACKGTVSNATGVRQYVVVGRRERVQHDWVSPSSSTSRDNRIGGGDTDDGRKGLPGGAGSLPAGAVLPPRATRAIAVLPADADYGTCTVNITMATTHPVGSEVAVTVSWVDPAVWLVSMALRLRVPSWLDGDVAVTVNGDPEAVGHPGTFVVLDRKWARGDTVRVNLTQTFRLVQYTGDDQIKGYEGRRYALFSGPVLLACTGAVNVTAGDAALVPVPPRDPAGWLAPVPGSPLFYSVRGAPQFVFKPMWAMGPAEPFTTFPVLTRL